MKFILNGPFGENIYNLMRKIGYHFQGEDKEKKEFIFTRPPREYPRFHLYSKQKRSKLKKINMKLGYRNGWLPENITLS